MKTLFFAVAMSLAAELPGLAAETDIGFRFFDGVKVSTFAVDTSAGSSPIKVKKNGTTYGVMTVAVTDPDATKFRVKMANGTVKALKKYNPAKWYQTPKGGADCAVFCAGLGKTLKTSPEGNGCVSGETRAKSAFDNGITFYNGCWSSCYPDPGPKSTFQTWCSYCANDCKGLSKHWGCWTPGQKKDCDGTDATVACFCG